MTRPAHRIDRTTLLRARGVHARDLQHRRRIFAERRPPAPATAPAEPRTTTTVDPDREA